MHLLASYDALSRPNCTAQRMNPATYGTLPASACTLATTGAYGPDRITRTSYDWASHPTLVQQAYATADQADAATMTYWTDNGKLITLADANGNVTHYIRDGYDRPESTHYPNPAGGGSSTTDFEQVLAYDANSNPTSLRLRDGNTPTLGYDALNRLVNPVVLRGRPLSAGNGWGHHDTSKSEYVCCSSI